MLRDQLELWTSRVTAAAGPPRNAPAWMSPSLNRSTSACSGSTTQRRHTDDGYYAARFAGGASVVP
jgi:hypothetical protein